MQSAKQALKSLREAIGSSTIRLSLGLLSVTIDPNRVKEPSALAKRTQGNK
jgi:hypothetical protein